MFAKEFETTDFRRFAGKFVEVESQMFDHLPADSVIVVGGNGYPKPTSYGATCWLCRGATWLDRRDGARLAGQSNLCILCPECYLKMEPKLEV